jgi:hypothetical protein
MLEAKCERHGGGGIPQPQLAASSAAGAISKYEHPPAPSTDAQHAFSKVLTKLRQLDFQALLYEEQRTARGHDSLLSAGFVVDLSCV